MPVDRFHDVICTGADTLGDAFAYAALAMFAYKTDVERVEIDATCTRRIAASGAWQPI